MWLHGFLSGGQTLTCSSCSMKKVEQIHQVRNKQGFDRSQTVFGPHEGSSWSGRICFSWDQVHDISWHCLSTWHIWKTLENNDPSLPDSIDDCSPSHRPGAQQIPSWKCYCNLKSAKWPRSIKIQPWKRLDIKWKTKMHVQCSITLPLGYKMILQRLNGKEAQTSMNRR